MLLGLFGEPERYASAYWSKIPGYYYPGDYAVRDEQGYFFLLGRADEVLKVSGHRLGTIEIEDALLTAPEVAEAAVCGIPDEVRGEVPVAFVVLRAGVPARPGIEAELAELVADRIGRIARPAQVHLVASLPKTRSGKILRRVVRAAAEGRTDLGDVSTLEDGVSVEEVRRALDRFRRELGERP
jgi:acetyl-CoA synthetase